jgi:hypothetical protein
MEPRFEAVQFDPAETLQSKLVTPDEEAENCCVPPIGMEVPVGVTVTGPGDPEPNVIIAVTVWLKSATDFAKIVTESPDVAFAGAV